MYIYIYIYIHIFKYIHYIYQNGKEIKLPFIEIVEL